MTDSELKSAATALFTWFKDNRFENSGAWDRETNLLFAFDEFVSSASDYDLSNLIDSGDYADARKLRQLVEDGTVYCLNHKNLTFWGGFNHEYRHSVNDSVQPAHV